MLAYSINDSGLAVGHSGDYAVVWQQNGNVNKLACSAYMCSEALGINSDGWVVGSVTDLNGLRQAVVWQTVPEPSSLLALLSGFAGIGLIAWRRRR